MSIADQLEEERRIINAATDCEADYYEGRSFNGLHEVRGVGNYNNDSSIAEDRFMIPADGKRLAHSWNALPLRNAQVQAVLALADSLEKSGTGTPADDLEEGHMEIWRENAAEIRRAIEGAGA